MIPSQVLNLLAPLDFTSMYDLGNKKSGEIPYRAFYEQRAIIYDSIDINRLDGSLPLDLSTEIHDLAPREMVANIGTSEHVLNQVACFKNIHNLATKRMCHWVPLEKRHPQHGFYGYSFDFFIELGKLNHYEITKLYLETTFKNWYLICCAYQKKDQQPFRWTESWNLCCNPCGDWGPAFV